MLEFGVAELRVPQINSFKVHFYLKLISPTACGPDEIPFRIFKETHEAFRKKPPSHLQQLWPV